MEKESGDTKLCLQRGLVLPRTDSVRKRKSQNFTNSKGIDEGAYDSQRLSKIRDAEVTKYLNNEKEARYKRIIWEIMNRDCLQGNKQKRIKKEKNVAKPPTRVVKNEKRLNSKINYDALNKLNQDDWIEKMYNNEDVDYHRRESPPNNEKLISASHSSGDDIDNTESLLKNTASEESDDIEDGSGMTEPEIDDEYVSYDEEYDYEEY